MLRRALDCGANPVMTENRVACPSADIRVVLPPLLRRWSDLTRCSAALARRVTDRRAGILLGALVIFALVLIVYSPILPGTFLIDDHRLIKEKNPIAIGELSPMTIWFRTDFALSTVVLWLQWLAWGENPGGYHAV